MRASILKRGLLRYISDCAIDCVAEKLSFVRVGETEWTKSDCLGWSLYDFANAIIFSVLWRQT